METLTETVLTKEQKIEQLYDKVLAKRAEISKAEKGKYVTDGIFRFARVGAVTDIKIEKSLDTLVEIQAFLLQRKSHQKEAAELLGVEQSTTWLGATFEDWTNDLKTRATQINLTKEKAKLADLEGKLLKISPALLEKLELAAIEAALA